MSYIKVISITYFFLKKFKEKKTFLIFFEIIKKQVKTKKLKKKVKRHLTLLQIFLRIYHPCETIHL